MDVSAEGIGRLVLLDEFSNGFIAAIAARQFINFGVIRRGVGDEYDLFPVVHFYDLFEGFGNSKKIRIDNGKPIAAIAKEKVVPDRDASAVDEMDGLEFPA